MRKPRVTARRLAAALEAQEQYAGEMFGGAPEEWVPFYSDDASFSMLVGGDEDSEGGGDDEGDEEPELFQEFSSYSNKDDNGRPHYRRDFGSVRDFCEQPFANKQNEQLFLAEENGGKFDDWDKRSLEQDRELTWTNMSWYGARSAQQSMDHACKGWPEGAERVRKLMQQVDAPPPVSLRRKVQRADQGDELDIHEVYRGGLDRAWSRKRRQHSRARMSVRIVAQIGGSKLDSADYLFWRGAAVSKLAEALEESGYRVEILGAYSEEQEIFEEQYATFTDSTFMVKDAGAPIDLEAVAGVVCNAGFQRTYGFRAAYAMVEHAIRPAQPIYKVEYVKVGRKTEMRRTLTNKSRRLLARTAVRSVKVEKLGLDADGTLTFLVPLNLGSQDAAQEWVKKSLEQLEASNTQ